MSIDDDYPELAKLVEQEGKTTLANLAMEAEEGSGWIDLKNCAGIIVRNKETHPRDPFRADPYGYLATLNELLKLFDEQEAPRKKLWDKIKVPGEKGSSFLDTVAEAALAVQLRRQLKSVALEVPFDKSGVITKKDADIVVDYGNGKVWLDAISVQRGSAAPSQTESSRVHATSQEPMFGASEGSAVETIVKKAHGKYEDKFKVAVDAGLVEVAGILMCIVKNEEDLFLPFLGRFIAREPLPDPPETFWLDHPNLNLVYVHTLRKEDGSGSDILLPVLVLTWRRPAPATGATGGSAGTV